MLARGMLLVCMGAMVMGFIGCAPTIVSMDAGVYQHGTLYAAAGKDLDSVYAATLQAMDKLQLQVIDKAKDVFGAKVRAKSADGELVIVKMQPAVEKRTEYEIHVGAFGNEERSRRIFSEIENALGAMKGK